MEQAQPVGRIDVISDAICPWCYIGKRHLERALAILDKQGLHFTVAWHPFQLNPDMPPEGMTRDDYVRAKFGGGDRPRQIYQAIAESGRGGRLDRIPCRTLWELSEGPGALTTVVFTFWTEPAAIVDRLRELGRTGWWRRRWKRALRRLGELIESGADVAAPRERVAGADRVPASPR